MPQDATQQQTRRAIERALEELEKIVDVVSERSLLIERTLLPAPPTSPQEGKDVVSSGWLPSIRDRVVSMRQRLQPIAEALQHVMQETVEPDDSVAKEAIRR